MDAGLGGVFRGKIWNPGEEPRYESRSVWKYEHNSKRYVQNERKHESSIWPEDYNALALEKADILVLHEAPTSDMHGYQVLDDLAERLGVRLIVHGHHHRQYTATLDNVDYDVSRDVGGLLHFTTDYAQKLFDLNQDILDSLEIIHPMATESNRIGFL